MPHTAKSNDLGRSETGTPNQTRTPELIIVLPIFNERANLERVFESIREMADAEALVYRIVAVDDGSSDGSAELLDGLSSHLPLNVVRHAVNQGLGAAIRDGLIEALRLTSSDDDVIVTMDSDESHTPGLIRTMLDKVEQGADVVIASRFQPGAACHGVPFHRQCMSVGASWTFRMLFPTRGVRDFTCGYRAYRAGILARCLKEYGPALFEFDGFQCMVDLLLKLRSTGVTFAEVPLVLRYDLKQGKSKMRVLRTAVNTLRLALSRRFGL
jgi:dolichol-phosphate mannosyltransferase